MKTTENSFKLAKELQNIKLKIHVKRKMLGVC